MRHARRTRRAGDVRPTPVPSDPRARGGYDWLLVRGRFDVDCGTPAITVVRFRPKDGKIDHDVVARTPNLRGARDVIRAHDPSCRRIVRSDRDDPRLIEMWTPDHGPPPVRRERTTVRPPPTFLDGRW